jgi:hypothetical protein
MVAAQTVLNLPDLTAEQAEHWVAAALAEARALRQHDTQLYRATHDPAAMWAAEQLHSAWRRWADEASALHARVQSLVGDGQRVAGADDLGYGIARANAMLKLSPELILNRAEQVRQGDVAMAEEVRRELRLADRR